VTKLSILLTVCTKLLIEILIYLTLYLFLPVFVLLLGVGRLTINYAINHLEVLLVKF